jgi:hypothetical protein
MLNLTFPPPVDFAALLSELRRAGVHDAEIVKITAVTRASLHSYRTELSGPSFPRGEALIALWCERTGRPREAVPRAAKKEFSPCKICREHSGPAEAFSSNDVAQAASQLQGITRAWGAALPAT